jgi:hypothetical protein
MLGTKRSAQTEPEIASINPIEQDTSQDCRARDKRARYNVSVFSDLPDICDLRSLELEPEQLFDSCYVDSGKMKSKIILAIPLRSSQIILAQKCANFLTEKTGQLQFVTAKNKFNIILKALDLLYEDTVQSKHFELPISEPEYVIPAMHQEFVEKCELSTHTQKKCKIIIEEYVALLTLGMEAKVQTSLVTRPVQQVDSGNLLVEEQAAFLQSVPAKNSSASLESNSTLPVLPENKNPWILPARLELVQPTDRFYSNPVVMAGQMRLRIADLHLQMLLAARCAIFLTSSLGQMREATANNSINLILETLDILCNQTVQRMGIKLCIAHPRHVLAVLHASFAKECKFDKNSTELNKKSKAVINEYVAILFVGEPIEVCPRYYPALAQHVELFGPYLPVLKRIREDIQRKSNVKDATVETYVATVVEVVKCGSRIFKGILAQDEVHSPEEIPMPGLPLRRLLAATLQADQHWHQESVEYLADAFSKTHSKGFSVTQAKQRARYSQCFATLRYLAKALNGLGHISLTYPVRE